MTQSGSIILIVDDNPHNIELLRVILREHTYIVQAASSGAHALESIQKVPPDLILLDIMMPEMDGYEVCERLKSDEVTRDIPVIFVSAMTESVDKVKGFQVGAVDYITKPFNLEEVASRVATQLKIRHLQQQNEQRIQQLSREIAERQRAEDALQHAHNELETKNRQMERVHILFRSTLNHLTEAVQRGANRAELIEYLVFIQNQFDSID